MKYPDVTLGRIEAVWNKLGGEEGVNRFLRGEIVVSEPVHQWREQDGVIYFSVTSDGTAGPQWIERLESKGFQVSKWARELLQSSDFKSKNGVTYEIAVIKGMLFNDNDRITKKIRAEAERRNLILPNPEIACLIREKFSDKEIEAMGFNWIIAMHNPIKDSVGDPILLSVNRYDRWLYANYDDPDFRWYRDFGFAFVVSQVS